MDETEVLHPQRRLRVAVAVRPVRPLGRGRHAPAEPVEHGVQDVDEAEVCQGLVRLALPPGPEQGAEDEEHLHLSYDVMSRHVVIDATTPE